MKSTVEVTAQELISTFKSKMICVELLLEIVCLLLIWQWVIYFNIIYLSIECALLDFKWYFMQMITSLYYALQKRQV